MPRVGSARSINRIGQTLLVCLLLPTWGQGCDQREPIETYTVPKDPPRRTAVTRSQAAVPPSAPVQNLAWRLPEGWRVQEGQRPMRFATLEVGGGNGLIEVAITRLGGHGGPILDNINRWREQVDLPPIKEEDLDGILQLREIDGIRGFSLTLNPGPQSNQAMAITVLYRPPEGTWFCKMTGPPAAVARQASAYETFMQSWRFTAAQDSRPAAPPASSPARIHWTTPAGWQAAENPGPMRLALFVVGTPAQKTTASVSRLGGDGGGMLANVNRWRNQVGLPPVANADDAGLELITIDSHAGRVVTLTGPGPNPEQMRIAFVARSGFTWFIKLRGPRDVVSTHANAFDDFVASIRF